MHLHTNGGSPHAVGFVPKIKHDVILNCGQRITGARPQMSSRTNTRTHTHAEIQIKYSKRNIIANHELLKPAKNTLQH